MLNFFFLLCRSSLTLSKTFLRNLPPSRPRQTVLISAMLLITPLSSLLKILMKTATLLKPNLPRLFLSSSTKFLLTNSRISTKLRIFFLKLFPRMKPTSLWLAMSSRAFTASVRQCRLFFLVAARLSSLMLTAIILPELTLISISAVARV